MAHYRPLSAIIYQAKLFIGKGGNAVNNSTYALSFMEGLLTFISPCILPLLPVYFFYLAGVAEKEDIRRGKLVLNGLAFVFGFSLVFVTLGATATWLGLFLQGHLDIFRQISGLVMIAFGLHFTGVLHLCFLDLDRHLHYEVGQLDFLRSIVFGVIFAFGWTPCVGIFLGSALLLAGNAHSLGQGMLLLLLYSAGLGVPFILSAWAFDLARDFFRRLQRHSRSIRVISGIVLILAGLLIYTGRMGGLGGGLI
jgi:cytochrome c-type biogenesis protein